MQRAAVLWILALAPGLPGCGDSAARFDWQIQFETDELRSRAVAVEATIIPDGCAGTGDPVYQALVRPGDTAMRPGTLPAGTYGFAGRARDSRCGWYAGGCTEVALGEIRPETVVTTLRMIPREPLCPPDECIDSECGGPDAGMDAGLDDGGDDGGRDAGVDSAVDAPGDDAPGDTGPDTPPTDVGVDGGSCVGAMLGCARDTLTECVGGTLTMTPCALGCFDATRCAEVDPANVDGRVSLDDGTGDVDLGASASVDRVVFNTDDGSIRRFNGGIVVDILRPAGAGADAGSGILFRNLPPGSSDTARYGVFVMGSLRVPAGVTVEGEGESALLLLVSGLVEIQGTIDVSATATGPGPGGFAGGMGAPDGGGGRPGDGAGRGEGGRGGSRGDSGGGGGGFGRNGGQGGNGETFTPGGMGGISYGIPTLEPLQGGSGGGSGAGPSDAGGHGGGALQITSGTEVRIRAGAIISACGGGGGGGLTMATTGAGSGGGSGGGVLIEAPVVTLAGTIGANGGGGGSGAALGPPGVGGDDGDPAAASAAGGPPVGGASGRGGDGSDSTGIPSPGATDRNAGGGGGAGGRIRINTATGSESFPPGTLPTFGSGLASVGMVGRR